MGQGYRSSAQGLSQDCDHLRIRPWGLGKAEFLEGCWLRLPSAPRPASPPPPWAAQSHCCSSGPGTPFRDGPHWLCLLPRGESQGVSPGGSLWGVPLSWGVTVGIRCGWRGIFHSGQLRPILGALGNAVLTCVSTLAAAWLCRVGLCCPWG